MTFGKTAVEDTTLRMPSNIFTYVRVALATTGVKGIIISMPVTNSLP